MRKLVGFGLYRNLLGHIDKCSPVDLLDGGAKAQSETSRCKVFCSEALSRVVDRSLQVLGGLGTTGDTVVERTYRDIRAFRIYDGPSEVHRHVLARNLLAAS